MSVTRSLETDDLVVGAGAMGMAFTDAPVNDLARLTVAPSRNVIVGSGKSATDGIVWLALNGVPPDRITWVRPREPWMLNRAVVQPDPVAGLELAGETMAAAASAESLDDLFLRLAHAGVMLRIDRRVVPTMPKTPTLAESVSTQLPAGRPGQPGANAGAWNRRGASLRS